MENVADILEPLAPLLPRTLPFTDSERAAPATSTELPTTDSESARLLSALGHDPMSLDQLATRCGLDIVTVTNLTLDLELDGTIQKVSGGNFVRTGTATGADRKSLKSKNT